MKLWATCADWALWGRALFYFVFPVVENLYPDSTRPVGLVFQWPNHTRKRHWLCPFINPAAWLKNSLGSSQGSQVQFPIFSSQLGPRRKKWINCHASPFLGFYLLFQLSNLIISVNKKAGESERNMGMSQRHISLFCVTSLSVASVIGQMEAKT